MRTAASLSTADPDDFGPHSKLLEKVIEPAVRTAGEPFLTQLDPVTVEELCESAERLHLLEEEKSARTSQSDKTANALCTKILECVY